MVTYSDTWGTSSWIDSSNFIWSVVAVSGTSQDNILYQIYTDDVYIYAAHSSGVSIINIQSEQPICYIENIIGFNTITGNSENVYLGTVSSGVFYFSKSFIYGTEDSLGNISSNVHALTTTYLPSSKEIKHLSIYEQDLAVVTSVGVDIIGMAPGKAFKSTTFSSGISKCFLTSKKELYYIEYLNGWSLCRTIPYLCDWIKPTTQYRIKNSFLEWDVDLIDLFITEDTSLNGMYNTVFLATSSGIYVYDEGTATLDIYL